MVPVTLSFATYFLLRQSVGAGAGTSSEPGECQGRLPLHPKLGVPGTSKQPGQARHKGRCAAMHWDGSKAGSS